MNKLLLSRMVQTYHRSPHGHPASQFITMLWVNWIWRHPSLDANQSTPTSMQELMLHNCLTVTWSICTTPSTASVLYLSHLPTSMAVVKLLYRPHIDTCHCTSTGNTYAQLNLTHSIGVNHCDSLFKLWHYHTCCRPCSNWTEETVAATICCYILLETLLMLLHPFAAASFHDSLILG